MIKDKVNLARLAAGEAGSEHKHRGKLMKKNMQRVALAAILGTFVAMTGCDQSNNSKMNGYGKKDQMQDRSSYQGMDQDSKPMPRDQQSQYNQNQYKHGGSYQDGEKGQQDRGSQYHYSCD